MLNNDYKKQIDSNIYYDKNYLTPGRISTYCLLITNVFNLKDKPKNILEIGPGNKILTNFLKNSDFNVETIDFESQVEPDYIMDITSEDILKINKKYDLVIASQVFEHVEYKDFISTLKNLTNITDRIFITLPHNSSNSFSIFSGFKLPFLKYFFISRRFNLFKKNYFFNGQHYWEIGTKKTSLNKIKKDIKNCGWEIEENYNNHEYFYHHFFDLKKV